MLPRQLVVAAALMLVVAAQPANALPGPDPAGSATSWDLVFEELGSQPLLTYEILNFQRSDGWDYGDREGYQCAFVERFDAAGNLLFELEFERAEGYQPGVRINTRSFGGTGGGESHTDHDICGAGGGEGSWVPSGEDHFPHHTHQHLFVDGVELTDGYLDLHRDDCARGYWTPGDEPGEAVLWWDEDGPQHAHPDGPLLPCGGGNQEPQAVARMLVIPVAANAGVCTHDEIDGSRCTGMTDQPPPGGGPHRSTVTLELRGHLRAFGFVGAPDGTGACTAGRTVRVERRVSGRWRTSRTDVSTSSGYFSIRLADREGTYRTRVLGTTLASGDVCQTAVSRKRVYGG